MRKTVIIFFLICLLPITVSAADFTAPEAPAAAEKYMPEEVSSFGADLWYVVKTALGELRPHVKEAAGICVSLIAVTLLISVLHSFTSGAQQVVDLVGTLTTALLLTSPASTLIQLGVETVRELSQYGKLLLPVMTAAMAAQGAPTTSAALYAGTALFNTMLTGAISGLAIPLIYIFIVLCIANSAIGNETLKKLRDFIKWLLTWCLKIAIYLFTGYLGITGVVSGTADAAAIKATKLAISGFVPVIGNVISDASETILVSAGVMKSAAGIYGLIAVAAICIGPFLQIGTQYLMLKITASVCGVFGCKSTVELIRDFSAVMGFLLAITGTVCILLLISTVCFMKGVG